VQIGEAVIFDRKDMNITADHVIASADYALLCLGFYIL
jgi:hypothetical protein